MTTPTNFQRLPSESSFYNGQMVMGAQASSLALALKQLQGVKYRALANYHVSRTTWQLLYWVGPVYTEAQLIKFQAPYDLVSARQGSGTGVHRTHTGAQPYAFPSGGLSTFTEPRPLYVPQANRGEVLLLCVQAENCRVLAVNVFDIYKEA
jgi:hypothetical protein